MTKTDEKLQRSSAFLTEEGDLPIVLPQSDELHGPFSLTAFFAWPVKPRLPRRFRSIGLPASIAQVDDNFFALHDPGVYLGGFFSTAAVAQQVFYLLTGESIPVCSELYQETNRKGSF